MRYFPVNLDVHDKKAVVVGGGKVALRKVRSLRACGARVTVVSPQCIAALGRIKDVRVLRRPYRTGDIGGAFLVIGATDSEAVNRRVWRDASRRRIPVNVVDRPDLCSFTVPSAIHRGRLLVTVSTGGGSPALARRIKTGIAERIRPALVRQLDLLQEIRPQIRSSGLGIRARMALAKRMAGEPITAAIERGGVGAGREILRKMLATATRRSESTFRAR